MRSTLFWTGTLLRTMKVRYKEKEEQALETGENALMVSSLQAPMRTFVVRAFKFVA